MSETVSPGQGGVGGWAEAPPPDRPRSASGAFPGSDYSVAAAAVASTRPLRRRRRIRWIAAGVVVVLAAGGAVAWRSGVFSRTSHSAGGQQAAAPATQPVVQENLSEQTQVDGTLGYSGSYPVTGQGSGTLTWLPAGGQVIRQGQVLYRTDDGVPVVLLYGSVPDWRALSEGATGADVAQLNHDLVDLGYASSAEISALGWDYYSSDTQAGVKSLQQAAGISSPSGSLALGSVVFEPTALRVATVTGRLGGPGSGPVLTGTSDQHVVSIPLSTSDESEVAVGDTVSITLPDGSNTPGKISSVGTVASGSSGNATIPVTVKLTDPSAAGNLDQAPVTVEITAQSVSNVLAVPTDALLAQSSGGYAVEVLGADNSRTLVPVSVGLFDDASGMVQVTGNLTPGEHVVVPNT